jgi:SAM-dependent methyltransferase
VTSADHPPDPADPNPTYYDRHAQAYFERTRDLDLSHLYRPFLARLAPGARILDAGCGPGRDLRAFTERGYDAVGFDASASMVRLAREHAGAEVHHLRFQDVGWRAAFDGIWACASLLHVPAADLAEVLARLATALGPAGVLYLSFGLGSGEREANGRRFTLLDEERLDRLLAEVEALTPLEVWRSQDVRTGRGRGDWLNALLQRAP